MYSRDAVVQLTGGLHSKPAGDFVQLAGKYKSDISLEIENRRVNAKSLLGVLSLGIAKGTEVTLIAAGEDAKEAVEALAQRLDRDI